MNNLAFINFAETSSLLTIELQNTLNYIYQIRMAVQFTQEEDLILFSQKRTNQKTLEELKYFSPTFTYEWRPTQRLIQSRLYAIEEV